MWTHLFLLLVCLLPAKTVLGLNCYGTEVQKLYNLSTDLAKFDNVSFVLRKSYLIGNDEPTIRECNFLMRSMGFTETQIKDGEPRCFTAIITDDVYKLEIKGCAPKGQCALVKNLFRYKGYETLDNVDCVECEGENCNKESDSDLCPNSAPTHFASSVGVVLAAIVLVF